MKSYNKSWRTRACADDARSIAVNPAGGCHILQFTARVGKTTGSVLQAEIQPVNFASELPLNLASQNEWFNFWAAFLCLQDIAFHSPPTEGFQWDLAPIKKWKTPITLLRVIPHIPSYSDILSHMCYLTHSDILSDILSHICSDIGILSGILSDIMKTHNFRVK